MGVKHHSVKQRCSSAGLTLSFPCPSPHLSQYIPIAHHIYHLDTMTIPRVLGYAFPCQRDALEAWATQRELSHP